jgi:hypothetical protein
VTGEITGEEILLVPRRAITIEIYTQSPMELMITTQEQVLSAILDQPTTRRPN